MSSFNLTIPRDMVASSLRAYQDEEAGTVSKMLEYGGVIIYVYPNDHDPVHCHVFVEGSELRVYLPGYEIQLKNGKMPNTSVLKKVKEAVADNRNAIGKEWRRFHGN